MTSKDLQPYQVEQLSESIRRQLAYLNKLCARMQGQRFPEDDPVSRCAIKARNAMQALYVECLASGAPRVPTGSSTGAGSRGVKAPA